MSDVRCILPLELSFVWPQVKPLLAKAFKKYPDEWPDMTLDQLYKRLVDQRAYLMVLDEDGYYDLAIAFEFVDYPNKTVAHVLVIGGRGISRPGIADAWLAFCKRLGATEIEAWCGKAMTRLLSRFGFTPKRTVVGRLL